VDEQLDCFPTQTTAILTGLSTELGAEVDDIDTQIRNSNTTFCTSGDTIRLGLDHILEHLDDS